MRVWLVLLAAAAAVAVSVQSANAGGVYMHLTGSRPGYTPGQNLSGNLALSYDVVIPSNAVLQALVNDHVVSELPLSGLLPDPSLYTYAAETFDYNITSQGTTSWYNYPARSFSYSLSVRGECGGEYCYNLSTNIDNCQCGRAAGECTTITPAPAGVTNGRYPCSWTTVLSVPLDGSVRNHEGLKYLFSADGSLFPPYDANRSRTVWEVSGTNPSQVQFSMRKACGGERYMGATGYIVNTDGWVRRVLGPNELPNSAGNYRYGNIEPFDNRSLGPALADRSLFEPVSLGGIYKDGSYMPFSVGTGAVWEGSTGYMRIYNYIPGSVYEIRYLTPNGAHACAFTPADVSRIPDRIANWEREITVKNVPVTYGMPYVRDYTPNELRVDVPPVGCPAGALPTDCTITLGAYSAAKVAGPSDITFSFDSGELIARASTSNMVLTSNYSVAGGINLASIQSLSAPPAPGPNSLDFKVVSGSSVLGSQRFSISVCHDYDGDGYCGTGEGGTDCNDSVSSVRPGAAELCNGRDDDCDGQTDEGFSLQGKVLGTPCFPNDAWNMSECTGFWVCTANGANVECAGRHQPGELPEICGNGKDDDCDGAVDEATHTVNGTIELGCGCTPSMTRQCGNDRGECRAGYQVCNKYNRWGGCTDFVGPTLETCNGKDDNCDGTVDNVGGGTTAASTNCGCYGEALPVEEVCNGIDDDCNGVVDDGVGCCEVGEIRECGVSTGDCVPGEEACISGRWSGTCMGGVQPGGGRVDSDCVRFPDCAEGGAITTNCFCGNTTYIDGYCCGGAFSAAPCQDYNFSLWMIIAGAAIVGIVVFWLAALKFAA